MQKLNKLINSLLNVNVSLVYGKGSELPESKDLKEISAYFTQVTMNNEIANIPCNNLLALLVKLGDYVNCGILANRSLTSNYLGSNGTIPNAIHATIASLQILMKENLPDNFYKKNVIEPLFTFYKKELNSHCAIDKPELLIMSVLIDKIINTKTITEAAVNIIATDFLHLYFKSTPSLQKECMHLFQTIIKKHASERNTFFEEFKACLRELDANCFRKEGNLHNFTKIFLNLVEAFSLTNMPNGVKETSKKITYYRETFKTLWTNISVLLDIFLSACRGNDSNCSLTRELFKYFMTDLFKLAENPDWPISSLILTNLFKKMQMHLKRRDSPLSARKFLLECLQMLAPMFGYFKDATNVFELLKTVCKVFPKYTQQLEWLDKEDPIHVKLLLQKFLLDYNEMELNMEHHNNLYLCIWIEEYYQKCVKNIKQKINLLLEKPDYNKSNIFLEINVDEINVRKLIFKAVFFIDGEDVFNHFLELINGIPNSTLTLRPQVLNFFKYVCMANPNYLIHKQIQAYIFPLLYQKSKDYQCIRDILVTMFSTLIGKNNTIRDLYLPILYDTIFDVSVTVNKKALMLFAQVSDCNDYPAAAFLPIIMLRRFDGIDNTVTTTLVNIFQAKYFNTADKDTVLRLTDLVFECIEIELNKFEQIIKLIIQGEGEKKTFNASTNIRSIVKISTLRIIELLENNFEHSRLDIIKFLTVLELLSKCVPEMIMENLKKLIVILHQPNVPADYIIKYVKLVQNTIKFQTRGEIDFLFALEKRLLILIKNVEGIAENVMALLRVIVDTTGNHSTIKNHFRVCYQFIIKPNNIDDLNFDLNLNIVAAVLTHFALIDLKYIIITTPTFHERVTKVFMELIPEREAAFEGLAQIATRHTNIILQPTVMNLYQNTLKDKTNPARVLIILRCILNILQIEQKYRQTQILNSIQDVDKSLDNLEIIGDGNKEYSIIVKIISSLLENCLTAYLTLNAEIKMMTVKIIHFVVSLGLYSNDELVPHLLALTTDLKDAIVFEAVEVLSRIHSRFPNILGQKAMLGIRQSFLLQTILYENKTIYIKGTRICSNSFRVVANASYIFDNLKTSDRRTFLANTIQAIGNTNNKNYLIFILYLADNITSFNYYNKEDLFFLFKQIDDTFNLNQFSIFSLKERVLKPNETSITLANEFDKIPTELFSELSTELLWIYGASLLQSIKLTLEKKYNISKSAMQKYYRDLKEKTNIKLEDALLINFTTLDNTFVLKRLNHMRHLKNLTNAMKKDIIDDIKEILKLYDHDMEARNDSDTEDSEEYEENINTSKSRKITMYKPGTCKKICP